MENGKIKDPITDRIKATTCRIKPILPTANFSEYLLKLSAAANHKTNAMIANIKVRIMMASDVPSDKATP
ncbi:MAG: hypothetical protein ACXQTU_02135 [Candidatus Nezhaarchaeales archaeon]